VYRRLSAFPSRYTVLLAFGVVSVVNYAFGLAMGWLLAPAAFGLLAFAQTILLIGGLVLNSGFCQALTLSVVQAPAERRPAIVRGAALANVVLGMLMGGMVLLLYGVGLIHAGLETAPTALLVAATFPFIALKAIACAGAQARERYAMMASLSVVEIVLKAMSGVVFVLLGYGVDGAVAGFLFGSLVSALLGCWLLVHLYGVPWGAIERPAPRLAAGVFGALLGLALLLNLDLMALKLFSHANSAVVGRYQASSILANVLYFLVVALLPILFVSLARSDGLAHTGAAIGGALRLALVVVAPLEFLLALAPDLALRTFFPPAYAAGAAALRLLALGNAAVILVAVLCAPFQATHQARIPARILLSVVSVEAIVLSVVVPRWSAVGASSTFLLAALIALGLLSRAYARVLGRDAVRGVLAWLGRYAASLVLGAMGTVAVAHAHAPLPMSVALGVVCYACGVFLAGLMEAKAPTSSATRVAAGLARSPLETGQ